VDEQAHSAATEHMPVFITAPGSTDVLMVVTAIILVVSVIAFGVLFLRLHTLPERVAHKAHKIQFEIVAILGLIALFTHMHIFWVAGLLLAFIDIPDFGGFFGRIAGSVERMAGVKVGTGAEPDEAARLPVANAQLQSAEAEQPGRQEPTPSSRKSARVTAGSKELDHA